ncbi:MAG: AAA family ATPase, partial [Synechococcaceae cyanobacterium SM2_3_2]|nr:AAA family ATPase [Synechococcaceae cyanobacterium SM2_3_2]
WGTVIKRAHSGQDVNLDAWAERTTGWSGADLALLSNRAAIAAIRRHRVAGELDPGSLLIASHDFEAAYAELMQQHPR